MKTQTSSTIFQLSEIAKQKTDNQGRIEYDVGQALSDAYFDALVAVTTDSAEELFRLHLRKAKNERLRIVKVQPST